MAAVLKIASIMIGLYLLIFGPISSDIFLFNQGLGLALMIGGPLIVSKVL